MIPFVVCVQMEHIHKTIEQAVARIWELEGGEGLFTGTSVSFGHDESPQTYIVSMVALFVNIIH